MLHMRKCWFSLQEVQLTGKSVAGIMKLFADDLFGTGGNEMEQRVVARFCKDFQVGSEDWIDVTFTGQRIRWTADPQSGPCIEGPLMNWRRSQWKEIRRKISTVHLQCIHGTAAFCDK